MRCADGNGNQRDRAKWKNTNEALILLIANDNRYIPDEKLCNINWFAEHPFKLSQGQEI